MEVAGMLYGAKLLQFSGCPPAEVLGPNAGEEDIKAPIEKQRLGFCKARIAAARFRAARSRPRHSRYSSTLACLNAPRRSTHTRLAVPVRGLTDQ
jgi:hypothetical protein